MNHAEIVTRIQVLMAEAQTLNVTSPETLGTLQQMTLELINGAEKRRQDCLAQAETLKRQALATESQAGAYQHQISHVFHIFNGVIERMTKGEAERRAREAERQAKANESLAEAKPRSKRRGKVDA